MQKTLRVAALMLALCCPVYAGEIGCPPAPPPPPDDPGVAAPAEVDGLAGFALDLMRSVLTIF